MARANGSAGRFPLWPSSCTRTHVLFLVFSPKILPFSKILILLFWRVFFQIENVRAEKRKKEVGEKRRKRAFVRKETKKISPFVAGRTFLVCAYAFSLMRPSRFYVRSFLCVYTLKGTRFCKRKVSLAFFYTHFDYFFSSFSPFFGENWGGKVANVAIFFAFFRLFWFWRV